MSRPATIVWFRKDLRIADQPALLAACQRAEQFGGAVIPVFVWAPDEEAPWQPGSASRWWLHHSLAALSHAMESRGSRLLLKVGDSRQALIEIAKQSQADTVYFSRRFEPAVAARDAEVQVALQQAGISCQCFPSSLLNEPEALASQANKPFRVFTPFWKRAVSLSEPTEPLEAPRRIPAPARWPHSTDLNALGLLPKDDWASGLRKTWTPGELSAHHSLERFLAESLLPYEADRDRCEPSGTSQLSPHLHFGEISARQIWHQLRAHCAMVPRPSSQSAATSFLRQLYWREFAYHLMHHFPQTTDTPLREEFAAFPWQENADWLAAWQRGRTGYPLVDAGMRQLWDTGFIHNRARMVAASLLVKHLLIPWQTGARWFWNTLVDADLANNTMGWQWTAGSGADAAPYFRVFNPIIQGSRFDADGAYVRRWLPELRALPTKWLHQPFAAPSQVLDAAGIKLGRDYPLPLIEHATGRKRALAAFATMKSASGEIT